MLATIQSGATGYDITFPSLHIQDIVFSLEILEKTEINQHSDFKNIDPDSLFAKTDPNGEYCLPYAWGVT